MNKLQSWIKRRQSYFFLLRFNNSCNRQLMCRATWPSVGKKVKASLEYWQCLQYWSSFLIQSLYDHRGCQYRNLPGIWSYCSRYESIVDWNGECFIRVSNFSIVPCAILTSHCPLLYLLLSVSKCLYAIYTHSFRMWTQDICLQLVFVSTVLYASSFIFVFNC